MQLPTTSSLVSLFLAVGLFATSHARSLSYRMKGSETKACFYAYVDPMVPLNSALLQFYYAAGAAKGGDIVYIDASVTGPSGQPLHSQVRQTHAEVNIKPPQAGEYSLCLTHHGSPSDKDVDVDITLPTLPPQANQEKDETAKLENTVHKLQRELSDLVHTLRYVKNRERRNLETVESVEGWIFYISIFEVLLIIGMSLLQVTVLRMFFSGNRKQQRVRMVLEGLKRAEQFIAVLRNAGYRSEAGKALKPEHLDHEFESRPTTAALLALTDGLRARVLLQHLANLGLLDGLLERLDEAEQPKVMPTSEETERVYELNGQLERLLDVQSIFEQTLLAELEKMPLIEGVGAVDVPSIAQSESFDMLMAEYGELQEKIEETLGNCFSQLFTPLDTADPDEPVLRFKTVSNSELARQSWHPEDYAFYERKIATAVDALHMHGFELCVQDLMRGDCQIRAHRNAYQAEIYSQITTLQLRRLCLGTIFYEALRNLDSHLQKSCNELLESLNSAKSKMGSIIDFAQHRITDPSTSVVKRLTKHGLQIKEHAKRLKSLESSIAQVGHLSRYFLNDAGEVEPLPLPVKNEESALRSITMEMSKMLSINTTEATRLIALNTDKRLYADTMLTSYPNSMPVLRQFYGLGNVLSVLNKRLVGTLHQPAMTRIDVGVLSLHLLRIVGKVNLSSLICIVVANIYFIDALETDFRRVMTFLVVTVVVGAAKLLGIMPKLHIVLVWAVIAASVPIFKDEIRPVAALLMLLGIVILLLATKIADHLASRARFKRFLSTIDNIFPSLKPEKCAINSTVLKFLGWLIFLCLNATVILAGKDIDEWGSILFLVIATLGVAIACRYTGHWAAVFGVAAGWGVVAFWCRPSSSYYYQDYEVLLVATGVAFSHFLTAYEIRINVKINIDLEMQ